MISIATNCTGVLCLDVSYSKNLINDSISMIANNCTGLRSLNINQWKYNEAQINNDCIVSVANNCTDLRHLYLENCGWIEDTFCLTY